MVESHSKVKRLSRSISSGGGGTSVFPTQGPFPSECRAGSGSNINLVNFNAGPTYQNFNANQNPARIQRQNSNLSAKYHHRPGTPSSPSPTSTSNSSNHNFLPNSPSANALAIQSGRKEARSILYQGIYQKFNRVFSAASAFTRPRSAFTGSGDYMRVATSATVTPTQSNVNLKK